MFGGIFGDDEEARARRMVHVPTGRFGRPEEIANAVLHLASDEASWTNGAALVVDGGITVAYTTPP
jgi:NAD(P)-dependent dehydrogenase (short-subunit alcohol dehydrogenase family)